MKKIALAAISLLCSIVLQAQDIEGFVHRQLQTYPQSRLLDLYKSCFQDFMGAEHLVSDRPKVKAASKREESKTSFESPEREQARTKFKADDLDERVGYYGEQLVLLAQTLGLNTCWVGISYSKVPGTYVLDEGEKIACYIAIGYGETQGVGHKIETVEQVSNVSDITPLWFKKGVEAALLAPTAVNQQKFSFEYVGTSNNRHQVRAKKGFSMIGYTKMDLGIAKYHFEIGAGEVNFEWV